MKKMKTNPKVHQTIGNQVHCTQVILQTNRTRQIYLLMKILINQLSCSRIAKDMQSNYVLDASSEYQVFAESAI